MKFYKAYILYAYPDCYPCWLPGAFHFPDPDKQYFGCYFNCDISIETYRSYMIPCCYNRQDLDLLGTNLMGYIKVGNHRFRVSTSKNLHKFIARIHAIEGVMDNLYTFNKLSIYKKYLINYYTSSSSPKSFIVDSLYELETLVTQYPLEK